MPSVQIVADPSELDPAERVWGTGGWKPPEQREALDWLTFVRVLGWPVEITYDTAEVGGKSIVLVARELDGWTHADIDDLHSAAQRGGLVIARAPRSPEALDLLAPGAALGDRLLATEWTWTGAGPRRVWRYDGIVADTLEPGQRGAAWVEADGRPVVVAQPLGAGTLVVLGFHPGAARDSSKGFDALLVHLLTRGLRAPVAWVDLRNTMLLRMDDPGGSQNLHAADWSYPKLTASAWAVVGHSLAQRSGRMSVAYTAGWVDDGVPARGTLRVGGRAVERTAGAIHPSPLVRYVDRGGTVSDYEGEFDALLKLQNVGRVDVELHGYTHVHPDLHRWAAAEDRYDDLDWYRELGPRASEFLARLPRDHHPLSLGATAISKWFGVTPEVLVCPGEQWTNEALEVALDLGIQLVGSYYLALRHEDRLCWTTHLCSPYLDESDPSWFESVLPTVGYCHDQDLATKGIEWFEECLSAWGRAGAKTFTSLRQLARISIADPQVERRGTTWHLELDPRFVLLSDVRLCFTSGDEEIPSQVAFDGRTLEVDRLEPGVGRITLTRDGHARNDQFS